MKYKSAIILAGGQSLRMKPQIWIDKPLVRINHETLIDYQINWLKQYNFNDIIVVANKILTSYLVQHNLTEYWKGERLGTSGAVKSCLENIKSNRVYVMNVDDIVFYDPNILYNSDKPCILLVSKIQYPYSIVKLDKYNNVIEFKEKPLMKDLTFIGHYAVNKSLIEKYWLDKGSTEYEVFPNIKYILSAYEISDNKWITINTYKELLHLREVLHLRKY